MTTVKALGTCHVLVNSNGKQAAVHVDQLTALGEDFAIIIVKAQRNPGVEITVPGARDRKPRHSVIYGVAQ